MADPDRSTSQPQEKASDPDGIRVDDRRHWARPQEGSGETSAEADESAPAAPTLIDEYRKRTEAAERKLLEYIGAFREAQQEQEQIRERLARDVERRVALQFGSAVEEILGSLDDLDLVLAHAAGNPAAEPLARGVALARGRFLAALERQGVERFELDGEAFDPNLAEAVRVDPVTSPARDSTVTETLRAGYKLGERILRPARVAVGRHGA